VVLGGPDERLKQLKSEQQATWRNYQKQQAASVTSINLNKNFDTGLKLEKVDQRLESPKRPGESYPLLRTQYKHIIGRQYNYLRQAKSSGKTDNVRDKCISMQGLDTHLRKTSLLTGLESNKIVDDAARLQQRRKKNLAQYSEALLLDFP